MKLNENPIKEQTAKRAKSPWNFDAPHYDERSSCYVNAGSHHGVGHRQPVGTTKHTGKYAVPVGKHMGLTDDQVPAKNLILELEE